MVKRIGLCVLGAVCCYGMIQFLPQEWIIVYSNISGGSDTLSISRPVSFSPGELEDTYGALRTEGRSHEGLDILAPYGTTVCSVLDGVILYTGRDTYGGNVVKVLGEDHRIYYYAHLDSYLKFDPGQKVQRGERIGYVGKTGNALNTPAHLHFEIMNISWYLPLVTENVNPYPELASTYSGQ